MERAFRLAGLLRLRQLQQDLAAGQLATSHAALRAADVSRGGAQTALADSHLPDGDHRAWGAAVAARAAFGVLLIEATACADGARDQVHTSTGEWSAARSRSVVLEKLEDKHSVVVRYEDDRQERLVLDEVALRGARGALVLGFLGGAR